MLGIPKLGQDFAGAEVARKALMAGGAKAAAHGTTGLRRHAQRATVGFGDEHRFHRVATAHVEEPFDRAVARLLAREHRQRRDVTDAGELVAQAARQVGHLGEIGRTALVDPTEQLGGAEALFTELFAKRSQAVEVEIEQVGGHVMAWSRISASTRSCRGRRKRFPRQRFQGRRSRARRWRRCCRRSRRGWCQRRLSWGRWRP